MGFLIFRDFCFPLNKEIAYETYGCVCNVMGAFLVTNTVSLFFISYMFVVILLLKGYFMKIKLKFETIKYFLPNFSGSQLQRAGRLNLLTNFFLKYYENK